ncbi:MAG: orotate phosphoribosyltransferase [Elusimicrobia bacterium]|nr:orotate phosphoribosyltransferase [Elusimicrobiota bacterium]
MRRAMNKLDVVGLLQEHGAIISGHFELLSGLHSPTYIQTAVVLQYPHVCNKLAKALCFKFPQAVDVVLSPSMGGVIIGQEVAREKKCRAIFAERQGGAMVLRRDFRLEPGQRTLIVEDVLTTGRTTSELVSLAWAYGAKVVGVAAIVDRSMASLPLKVPVRALVPIPVKVSAPESCPLCARGTPLTRPGMHNIEFLHGLEG